MDNSPAAQREVWRLIYTQDIPKELKGRLELVIKGATPKAQESLQNVMAIEYQYDGIEGAIAYVQRLEKTRLANSMPHERATRGHRSGSGAGLADPCQGGG